MPLDGRKPLPTELHLLHGNPGKRRRNPSVKAPVSSGKVPGEVGGKTARKTWRRLAPVLSNLGILTELDELALGLLCDAVQDYEAAKLDVEAMRSADLQDDRKVKSAQVEKREQRKAVMSMLAEFGLTPASRTRLIVPKGGGTDPLAEFLGDKRS